MSDAQSTPRILHNPRCSKSRATLELLQAQQHAPQVQHYLEHPPSAAELGEILDLLGMQPRELMRRGEAVYAELGLDDAQLGREQLIAAMVANPILIERPIVIANGRAAIGRPPQRVLDIL